ncbi:ABC transporter substrate-binding protein [soil metagenome]
MLILLAVLSIGAAACTPPGPPDEVGETDAAQSPADDGAQPTPQEDDSDDAAAPPTTAPTATEPPPPVRDEYAIAILDPESLVPADNAHGPGGQVLAALYTPLITYDPVTTEPVNAVAESITTEDSRTFTITVADGWTFHNGQVITAQTFADSFDAATDPETPHSQALLYADIEGTTEQGQRQDDQLRGVQVVDEMTFTVTLRAPFSTWPVRLGYPAFAPLPNECLQFPDDCVDAPIGNGPYQMEGTWQRGEQITVTRWEDYPGEDAGIAQTIRFDIQPDIGAALRAVRSDEVDIVAGVSGPQVDALRDSTSEQVVETPISSLLYLGLPQYDPRYGGEQNLPLRQALSLAIDREMLTTEVVPQWSPADSLISPVVPGHTPGACDLCVHDPERARALWDEHGGLEEIELWFNSGAGHEQWARAVADGWREVFGLPRGAVTLRSFGFTQYVEEFVAPRAVTGPFRFAWGMSYPSPEDYLAPLYGVEGEANHAGYRDQAFEDLLVEAARATTVEEGLALYRQAEQVVLEDMPSIPLFFYNAVAVHGTGVEDVVIDTFNLVRPQLVQPIG